MGKGEGGALRLAARSPCRRVRSCQFGLPDSMDRGSRSDVKARGPGAKTRRLALVFREFRLLPRSRLLDNSGGKIVSEGGGLHRLMAADNDAYAFVPSPVSIFLEPFIHKAYRRNNSACRLILSGSLAFHGHIVALRESGSGHSGRHFVEIDGLYPLETRLHGRRDFRMIPMRLVQEPPDRVSLTVFDLVFPLVEGRLCARPIFILAFTIRNNSQRGSALLVSQHTVRPTLHPLLSLLVFDQRPRWLPPSHQPPRSAHPCTA